MGVSDSHYSDPANANKQGSPRLGRLRGISPQSREKNYISGSNPQNMSQNNTTNSHAGMSASAASQQSSVNHPSI